MEEVFAFAFEAGGSIWHYAFALCCADLTAEVCLAGFAELAFFAFWCAMCMLVIEYGKGRGEVLESNNVVSRLDRSYTLSHGFHYPSTLMPKNNWESSLGILARKCICIYSSISAPILKYVYIWVYIPV